MGRLPWTVAVLALVLAGCSAAEPAAETPSARTTALEQGPGGAEAQALLAAYDLDGLPVTDVIDRMDRLAGPERPTDLIASVRPRELVLSDGVSEHALALPDEEFYVSVAPYVDQTHECYFHSLTTCQGELVEQDVTVRVVDDAGEVLLDEVRTTFANGFVGMWLPRGVSGTIEITQAGRSGKVELSTVDDEDATCVTTLRLV